jgi:glycosyltransferase involved in cell wall biosynthesis
MKVMHVETGRHLYGGALQVFYLLRGLHEKGVENLLVCPVGSAIAREAAPFAQICDVPMHGDLDVAFGWRLWRLVKREQPDILHIHSRRGADLWGSLVARLTGQAAILTRRVDNPELVWLAHWKYRPYRLLVAISEGIRQILLAEGLPSDKVSCVHSALDTSAYQLGASPEWFRQEFDLPNNAVAVGVVAQMIDRKGHRFLIDAAPHILQRHPKVYFLFFGKGPEQGKLEILCRQTGIAEHVRFAGFRDDLPRILPNLDLVVHPALMEGLGIALLQASAAGIPIVAARTGGIPEVVHDGVNGFLVEPGQSGALSNAILEMLNARGRWCEFGDNGRRLVEENFSIAAMVQGNLNLYRVVSGARTPVEEDT